jgi:hypothetical protein
MITKVFIPQLVQSLFGITYLFLIYLFVYQHNREKGGKEKGVMTYI